MTRSLILSLIKNFKPYKKFQGIVKELFIRCRKLKISLAFIRQSYFSVPMEVRLDSTHYLIMKAHNKRDLQNIATNYSADIDYKGFMNIYRKCTSEPYYLLTIDTILPTNNSLRFRKRSFKFIIKMASADKIKILDNRIKANQAQYNLDQEAAKISTLSSKKLEKYEHLTGKDLKYKPEVVEQAKFEYSPLGKIFIKGLEEYDKKEGLLKRLKARMKKN